MTALRSFARAPLDATFSGPGPGLGETSIGIWTAYGVIA
jgi:hypothetical protein